MYDLESLRTGKLSESEFRAKCQSAAVSELLGVIWRNLEHYLADFDIRDRDPKSLAQSFAKGCLLIPDPSELGHRAGAGPSLSVLLALGDAPTGVRA
jgi:hypothetical protein